jgi:hypothetical protein
VYAAAVTEKTNISQSPSNQNHVVDEFDTIPRSWRPLNGSHNRKTPNFNTKIRFKPTGSHDSDQNCSGNGGAHQNVRGRKPRKIEGKPFLALVRLTRVIGSLVRFSDDLLAVLVSSHGFGRPLSTSWHCYCAVLVVLWHESLNPAGCTC